jgi:RimJ/RimL family protein N-acetyltransferase
MINCDRNDMVAELGYIQILKPFQVCIAHDHSRNADVQRTHVLSNAAGCVIHRILDSESEGGLGLRRCQWFANSLNEPSKAAAKRLGFKQDGILRNHRVLGPGKIGASGTS